MTPLRMRDLRSPRLVGQALTSRSAGPRGASSTGANGVPTSSSSSASGSPARSTTRCASSSRTTPARVPIRMAPNRAVCASMICCANSWTLWSTTGGNPATRSKAPLSGGSARRREGVGGHLCRRCCRQRPHSRWPRPASCGIRRSPCWHGRTPNCARRLRASRARTRKKTQSGSSFSRTTNGLTLSCAPPCARGGSLLGYT